MTHPIEQTRSADLPSGLHLRPAEARGRADFGWLKSSHSFSFGQYFDPNHIQFEALRVINDDHVAAGRGFPSHSHKDAEIFSYVLSGALSHKDSLGNGSTVHAGGVQYMSAGTGVSHSEFNPSDTQPVHFLQIWLLPNVTGKAPRYETLDISPSEKAGSLKLFLSSDGREGSMQIRADADIYAATLDAKDSIDFNLKSGRCAWVQVAKGALNINGVALRQGDGLRIEKAGSLTFHGGQDAEIILFDLKKSA